MWSCSVSTVPYRLFTNYKARFCFILGPLNKVTGCSPSPVPFLCSASVCVWELLACLLLWCLPGAPESRDSTSFKTQKRRGCTECAAPCCDWKGTKVCISLHWNHSISTSTLLSIFSIYGSIRPPLIRTSWRHIKHGGGYGWNINERSALFCFSLSFNST